MAEPGIYLKTEEGLIPGATVPGPVGETGPGATVSVGSVITGAAGTNASVINTGTPEAAVLSFTIPRGNTGLQGIQGIQGPKGDPGEGSLNSINGDLGPDVILDAADVGAAPTVHTHTKSQITDFAHTHGGADITGTGKSATTFLRGDNTWVVPTDTTYAIPSQAEAEAGTATTARAFSAQRVNQAIQALAPVKSVAGKTGVITLVKADVGLANVDNTSDAAKPISTATQTALNLKANTVHTHAAADVTDVVTTNTNQTISGGKTFTSAITSLTGGGGFYLRATGANDHVYMSFSARADSANRTGWLGYGSNGSINFDMRNEITNGNINLSTTGTGVVQANGAQVVTTNDARLSDARTPLAHVHAQADITGLTTALAGKEGTITAGTTAQYWRGDKSWQTLNKASVGLANVDNTSDANKPISTATQTALNAKVNNSALAVANGVATLDANTKIPIVLIPTGNTSTTVVVGNDPRLSDARTPTAHTHAITDVTNLQSSLDAKAAAVHNHSASDITSGIMSQDRLVPNIARVVHNGTDYPARPGGVTYVEWVGPTEPPFALSNDTWVSTA